MASTEIDTFSASQPRNRGIGGRLANTKNYIYNSDRGEFFGRNASSWGKIGLFYLIYYACLAACFAGFLALFFTTIDGNYPKMRGMDSLIKSNPGMGFRPMPDVASTLIRFEQGKPHSYKLYTDNIQAFLEQYENKNQEGDHFIDCTKGKTEEDREKVCRFDINKLGPCTFQQDFGYDEGTPCIMLKLNKIYDWMPEPISSPKDFEEMPTEARAKYSNQSVYVTCEGENPADIDNVGNYSVYPPEGFPNFYFPYLAQEGYKQPLVMVQFDNPKHGVLMQISCKAWAANIMHHRNDRAGGVHFELLVD